MIRSYFFLILCIIILNSLQNLLIASIFFFKFIQIMINTEKFGNLIPIRIILFYFVTENFYKTEFFSIFILKIILLFDNLFGILCQLFTLFLIFFPLMLFINQIRSNQLLTLGINWNGFEKLIRFLFFLEIQNVFLIKRQIIVSWKTDQRFYIYNHGLIQIQKSLLISQTCICKVLDTQSYIFLGEF